MVPSASEPLASIQVVQTSPIKIIVHRIEDHQLERLTNISRPLTLAVAGGAAGAFFSLLPTAIDSFGKVGTAEFTKAGLIYCFADGVAFFLAIITSISAARGEREARKIVADIRAREQRPV